MSCCHCSSILVSYRRSSWVAGTSPFTVMTNIFTVRKRSLGQGNIFAPVCHSVHTGEYLGRYPNQVHPPGTRCPPGTRYTTRDQVHPQDQVHPPGPGASKTRYTPSNKYPPGPGTPPRTRYPPGTGIHPLGPDTSPGPGTPSLPAESSACWEIRATSGRYVPYWNAFLLSLNSANSVKTFCEISNVVLMI